MKVLATGFLVMVAFIGMAGIGAADIPDLIGNWTGPYTEYNSGSGFSEQESGFFFLNITGQKDRIFLVIPCMPVTVLK